MLTENKTSISSNADKPVYAEKVNKVAWLYLNRPQVLNGINLELAENFSEVLAELEADPETRVIVLSGMGKAFCAGGDLKAINALADEDSSRVFVEQAGTITAAIAECKKPVIAMVNGAAAGAGFNIALACDLIFAADNAKFIQSFAVVGLVPDCGGHKLLVDAVGTYKAKELIFTGRPVTAKEAMQLGFVNAVYSLENLKNEVEAFVEALANKASLAIYESKALLNRAKGLSLSEVLREEAIIQAKLIMSADSREGFTAFFEKRLPNFQGK